MRGLLLEKKKLIDVAKSGLDKENASQHFYPSLEPDDVFRPATDEQAEKHLHSYSSLTNEKLRNIEGRIKKATEDAARCGLLVVDISKLI